MVFWPREEVPAEAQGMKDIALLLFQEIPESQIATMSCDQLVCPTARVCLAEIDTIQKSE